MKTIFKVFILTVILSSTSIAVMAQAESNTYEQNPEIDKFVGTWEWTSGNQKFQLVIDKQKLDYSDEIFINYYIDEAVVWHSYTINGQVVSSSMGNVNTKFTNVNEAIKNTVISGEGTSSTNRLNLMFNDKIKHKLGKVSIELLPGKTNEATWKLRGIGTIYLPQGETYDATWSLPLDMVLTKKETTPTWTIPGGGWTPFF